MGVLPVIAVALILAGLLCIVLAYLSHRNERLTQWRQRPRNLPAAPTRAPVRSSVPHLLYCYYWATGGECYFGISNDPPARHERHAGKSEWFPLSTGVMYEVQWYPNRAAALAAERMAIRTASARGATLANDHHNPYARRRAV
jgi:hypothetical protein